MSKLFDNNKFKQFKTGEQLLLIQSIKIHRKPQELIKKIMI